MDHGIEFPFENTNAPKKQSEKILKYKEQFSQLSSDDDTKTITDDKMAIIAEALSEVVKEYMEKKTTEEEDEEDY